MLMMRYVQDAVVREPGRSAVLDPVFVGFALILLLAIGLLLFLGLRAVDSPATEMDEDAP